MGILNFLFGKKKHIFFPTEAKGESKYQRELISITGKKPKEGYRHEFGATLVPEDDNEHDKNAVKVLIKGKLVGYLSREDAAEYRARQLGSKYECKSRICCGGGDTYGVWLDVDLRPKRRSKKKSGA